MLLKLMLLKKEEVPRDFLDTSHHSLTSSQFYYLKSNKLHL